MKTHPMDALAAALDEWRKARDLPYFCNNGAAYTIKEALRKEGFEIVPIPAASPLPVETAPREPGLWVIFDAAPGAVTGRFVEVENEEGVGQTVGRWRNEGDLWALGPFRG